MSAVDRLAARPRWWRRGPSTGGPRTQSGAEADEAVAARPEAVPSSEPAGNASALQAGPLPVPGTSKRGPGVPRTTVRTRTRPTPAEGSARPAETVEPPAPPTPAGPRSDARLLIVEDVPEVVERMREVLRSQSAFKLVAVTTDGRRAEDDIAEHRPDVVLVDVLLQGRMKGPVVIERLRRARNPIPCVAITPSNAPLPTDLEGRVDSVLTLPFGTFDLVHSIRDAITAGAARNPTLASRIIAVFGAKGGVGKTTIAVNLAIALKGLGLRTALVDGSLQFGDVRRMLRAPDDLPSIIDLPTDSVRSSDLLELMTEGPAGIEVLLAPPRLEQAELVTTRDIEKILDMLRRTYHVVVLDTPSSLGETTLAFLDAADVIVQVVTPETATLDVTRLAAEAFIGIGYPPTKLQLLLNRADSMGPLHGDHIRTIFGRDPDYAVASDWALVAESNARAIPFIVAGPDAKVSADIRTVASRVATIVGAPPRDAAAGRRRRAARA